MKLRRGSPKRAKPLAKNESNQILLRDAACASGRRVRERCYCNARGPECHETQLGYKQSGFGRDKCLESLLHHTQTKSVWLHIGEADA